MRSNYTHAQKQEVISLRKLGKPLKEISELTGVKVNTIKTLLKNDRESNQTVNGADIKNKISITRGDNRQTITSVGDRIKTIDQLIIECDIDLDKWIITKPEIKKWDVQRKNVDQEMEWVSGRMDGYKKDHGDFTIVQLFSVSTEMVLREPEAIRPVISPINIKVGKLRKVVKKETEYKKGLLLFDPHIGFEQNMRSKKLKPFHDRKAIDIAFQFCKEFTFDWVGLGGDWQDNAMFSDKFQKKISYYFNTQAALCENSWTCGMLRKLQPTADMDYFEGNHEVRIENMIINHLLPAYGLRPADNVDGLAVMSVPFLLGLPGLNINYIGNYPGSEHWVNEKVVIRHGDIARKGSGATASAIAKESTYTEIFGHIHRFEWAVRTEHRNGKTNYIQAFSPGCLCKIDGTVPAKSKRPNWQQGFAIIHYNDEECFIDPVMIKDGKAFYQGKVYEGQDYTEQLIKDTIHHDKEGEIVAWNY